MPDDQPTPRASKVEYEDAPPCVLKVRKELTAMLRKKYRENLEKLGPCGRSKRAQAEWLDTCDAGYADGLNAAFTSLVEMGLLRIEDPKG